MNRPNCFRITYWLTFPIWLVSFRDSSSPPLEISHDPSLATPLSTWMNVLLSLKYHCSSFPLESGETQTLPAISVSVIEGAEGVERKTKNQSTTPTTAKPATAMPAILGRLDFLPASFLSGFALTVGFSVGVAVDFPAAATGVVAATGVGMGVGAGIGAGTGVDVGKTDSTVAQSGI